jgi:hypothetical protein
VRLRDAVRIEKRAAAIAAGMIHALSHDMIIEELVGWMRCGDNRERGSYPQSHAWQAGWLAAIIWSDALRDRRAGCDASDLLGRRVDAHGEGGGER